MASMPGCACWGNADDPQEARALACLIPPSLPPSCLSVLTHPQAHSRNHPSVHPSSTPLSNHPSSLRLATPRTPRTPISHIL